ncbi:hypothetical protein SPSYN_00405 [Sporotomaculum syntrophicum]|uniref:HD domain-containing protein n=2 Tax=Sporotomaculum syntrophicum TaxID=182264 RepID=A0A9D2WTJ2_9FIRM|nr:hypothetical protein SPSYN_00405 [Sporotomaculum syntrophicum]
MIEMIESKLNLKVDLSTKQEYRDCISDLAQNQLIYTLDDFTHHRYFSRLEHSIHVSFFGYLVCKKMGLDCQSAARGGLLHDFYFYDSRVTKPDKGIHCLSHPTTALKNALEYFSLNKVEQDIIVKHMWPVTLSPPKYMESYIVTMMDKYCATREVARYGSRYVPDQQTQYVNPSHRNYI